MPDAEPPRLAALMSSIPENLLGTCAYCRDPISAHAAFFVVGVGLHHRPVGLDLPPPEPTDLSRPIHSAVRLVCEPCGMGRKIIGLLLEDR